MRRRRSDDGAMAEPARVAADVSQGADPAILFAGESEMARLMRGHDWAATPLGSVESWPHSLRTAVRIVLGSRYPMFVWWGPDLLCLHNDAYVPILGKKQRGALGRPGSELWAETWDVLGPLAARVIDDGQATYSERLLLFMDRSGYPEETYFTFSFGPLFDDKGRVDGIFCATIEETIKVVGERRLRTLREVASSMTAATAAKAACMAAAVKLAENPYDLPFALIYLVDGDGKSARLAGAAGLPVGGPASPELLSLDDPILGPWPLADVLAHGEGLVLDPLPGDYPLLPGGPWAEQAGAAIVLPFAPGGRKRFQGALVAGINPRHLLDEEYRVFFDLIAGSIATGFAAAHAREEERRRIEALAEIDRVKTTFFSNVSHEFRTPLTLILGPLEELLSAPEGQVLPAVRDDLAVVHRNALRLLRLVNTLLDFSRIEEGRTQASYLPTDLASLTRDLSSVFRAAVERAGLRLVLDLPPLSQPVWVDREMWEKIVLNLISNAFKFTFSGEIRVFLSEDAPSGRAELRVEDTGVGIPASELPLVFERFHRVRSSRARTHEGTGIGLSLVQELVSLHGGTISIESDVGRGTLVTGTVPLGSDHLPADQLGSPATLTSTASGAEAFFEEALLWLRSGKPELPEVTFVTTMPPPRPDFPSAEEPAARVLVVDDNADLLAYVSRLLSRHWTVETASDGLEALRVISQERPDLVVADVMMPRIDGLELLRTLRAEPATQDIPVILLSARAGEEAAIAGLAASADDYLAKPFAAGELIARVRANLALARLRREGAERSRHHVLLEERQHLARNLHDSVLQALYAIGYAASAALEALETNDQDRLHETIPRIRSLVSIGLAEMRALLFELRPEALAEEGLVAALTKLVAVLRTRHDLQVETVLGDEPGAPIAVKESLYRIAQDALSDAARHAGVSRVSVRLNASDDRLTLEVHDDGVETDTAEESSSLRSIRNRIELCGGLLECESRPRLGSHLRASVPLSVAGK